MGCKGTLIVDSLRRLLRFDVLPSFREDVTGAKELSEVARTAGDSGDVVVADVVVSEGHETRLHAVTTLRNDIGLT